MPKPAGPGQDEDGDLPRPRKVRPGTRPRRLEGGLGPLKWLLPALEGSYGLLRPRDGGRGGRARRGVLAGANDLTAAVPGAIAIETADAAEPEPAVWRDIFLEYKARKAAAAPPAPDDMLAAALPAPFVVGGRNWLPLGPNVVMSGQTVGNQPVGGRVARIAVAQGANVVYAATANGGVFRSHDSGATWRALMDRFDLDPTSFASASLVCGAIAIDPADPRRVFVGTGEGDTLAFFRSRVTNALPAYRGVGVIRSDDAGDNWVSEPSNPDLAGEAFFALAVDPADPETLVGATTIGLFRREPAAGGGFRWATVRQGVHCDVAVARGGGATRFFCAQWGLAGGASGVFHSNDGGRTWVATGTGLPIAGAGRIALGVRPNDPDTIYAFVADTGGALLGLFRLRGLGGSWQRVDNVPAVLPGKQGAYDLAIAVDPRDETIVYLGGDHMGAPPYGGSVWRCKIKAQGNGLRVSRRASIGSEAHSDVHHLVHTPGNRDQLWCATDGGVFLNRNPRGSGKFASRNSGLSCLCSNFIAQHPSDPAILFTGLQDNGTARTGSPPVWSRVGSGDGGYCLIHARDPKRVLIFMNGRVWRSTTGGDAQSGWSLVWDFGWASMTQPFVGLARPASAVEADLVALGAGPMVYVSRDFAGSWPQSDRIALPGGHSVGAVFALTFASPTRLYAATTLGRVFRLDRGAAGWTVQRLDDAAAGPLGLVGLITDIAVDLADSSLGSVYVAFGGMGDRRRVWRFDGTRWASRSGAPGQDLLDVEHNAIAIDPAAPANVYVGADIGVWHSADSGHSWAPLQNGLPDAPVFDLQFHPTQRLLRAATHGRGVYEIAI